MATGAAMAWRFPARILGQLCDGKSLRIRAGAGAHRFIGIWVVMVKDPLFVRSWSAKPEGWYSVFAPKPAARSGLLIVTYRSWPFPSRTNGYWTRLIARISTNTTRPARSDTRGTWAARNPALPLWNYGRSSRCGNLDSHPSAIGHIRWRHFQVLFFEH